jgi:hypothetical protein
MLKQEKSDSTAADDFRSLAEAAPPCITITLPLPEPMGVRTRLKNALREAEKGLKESGAGAEQAELLLQPMKELAAPIGPIGIQRSCSQYPTSHQAFLVFVPGPQAGRSSRYREDGAFPCRSSPRLVAIACSSGSGRRAGPRGWIRWWPSGMNDRSVLDPVPLAPSPVRQKPADDSHAQRMH